MFFLFEALLLPFLFVFFQGMSERTDASWEHQVELLKEAGYTYKEINKARLVLQPTVLI